MTSISEKDRRAALLKVSALSFVCGAILATAVAMALIDKPEPRPFIDNGKWGCAISEGVILCVSKVTKIPEEGPEGPRPAPGASDL